MGNSFYNYAYYSSWLAAGIGFAWLLFLIRWRLSGEQHLTACVLYWAVTLALLSFVEDWREQKEWESFVTRHRCKIVEQWGGTPINGEYGKTAYHCADNFIYWRELK
ncbi:hypothetical protein [Neisseria zoodegmatis]|uniref:Integral membrane protein n=1 Tax=Neisseria zoodegmatis TaxID=326523 RepID=A0AB38DSH0_9NEIS|nr:hypothetical protein [Neisseria zoodegmatis]OSI10934.1 hypothetical protein BWD10_03205 [Neisseria zoodegmatis]SNU80171.1 Uncharacterised protein [Neisseria zoodegmatis]